MLFLFESLKKKFSRTSEKLEEELIEEAEAEDNLKEESGSRFSFFSFGRKKKEKETPEEDNLLPEADEDEEAAVEEVIEEPAEEVVEEAPVEDEPKEEKKSRFWSRKT